ncbi:unnamed protein product [Oikopleura dioica]|uniref:U-box domain-containing protein n=1 Tax=Oikopleura dioica TaxID=34765 RepID=E4YK29_OIKDI|nr:unnamed protein product [Oikopleura dioica]
MKLLNSQLDIEFQNPGKDDAVEKFRDSFSSGPIYFEHYIRSPASFVIKAQTPMIFKGINIKAKNCVLKVEISSDGKVFKNLTNLTFRENSSYSLHKAQEKTFSPRWNSQIIPARFSFKFVKLRFKFVKMFAGGVLGLDVLQIFGEKFSRNDCNSVKVSPEQSVEDTPARSFFGNYEDENKEENSQLTTSQPVSQLKIPHRVPISERQLPAWAIDSVTCSQMVHPIMLPSGYWVDRSTLEKWKKESLLWSRPPTDPFTGVKLPFELPVDEARRKQIFDLVHSPAFIN